MQPKDTKNVICPYCYSSRIKREGKRKNKLQTIQKFKCKQCNKYFTDKSIRSKSYPSKVILNAISYYNLGYTQSEVSKIIAQKHKINIPQKTISNWLHEYKAICTFTRLRSQSVKLYPSKQSLKQYNYTPETMLHKQTLNHIQPYTFKYHKAKLDILAKENPQFTALKDYINKITSKDFPHHIFTYNKNTMTDPCIDKKSSGNNKFENNQQRASQIKFSHLKISHISKTNQANQLAKLALNLATTNKERHQAIQDFMLINDSTTIAVEVPIYLTNWDAGYYRNQRGFIFPLSNYQTPITGHIDILQIRNNLIHILDYKPEAYKQKPIEQLTIYALALSRKLNLELYHMKCAWFDESNYYEFFPLHVVYKLKKNRKKDKYQKILSSNSNH